MGKILLVDDDELFLAVISRVLQQAGHSVSVTSDGPHALELFKDLRPDVVLLDVGLPSMNGIEVLRTIREIDAHARVIVVTGYGSPQVKSAALQHGASDFLLKPVDTELLMEKIRFMLSIATE